MHPPRLAAFTRISDNCRLTSSALSVMLSGEPLTNVVFRLYGRNSSMGAVTANRVELARAHYGSCSLCEHRCGADRRAGERGPCKAGPVARVYKHRLEYGEEWELVPSHLFYLSGCDLRCAFCVAEANAFDPRRGRVLSREFFAEAVRWGQEQGARTLQWVGGEPTIHLPAILDAMEGCATTRITEVHGRTSCDAMH